MVLFGQHHLCLCLTVYPTIIRLSDVPTNVTSSEIHVDIPCFLCEQLTLSKNWSFPLSIQQRGAKRGSVAASKQSGAGLVGQLPRPPRAHGGLNIPLCHWGVYELSSHPSVCYVHIYTCTERGAGRVPPPPPFQAM